MLQHEHRVLLRVLQLLEEQQWLLVVTEASFDTVPCRAVADEHGIVLPVVVVDLVFLECSGENLPGGVVEADLEALEVIRTILS